MWLCIKNDFMLRYLLRLHLSCNKNEFNTHTFFSSIMHTNIRSICIFLFSFFFSFSIYICIWKNGCFKQLHCLNILQYSLHEIEGFVHRKLGLLLEALLLLREREREREWSDQVVWLIILLGRWQWWTLTILWHLHLAS